MSIRHVVKNRPKQLHVEVILQHLRNSLTLEVKLLNVYIFVAAALLAVVPVVIIFNGCVNRLKEDPQTMKNVQKRFFIGAALSKIVPAILLMYGIIKMTPVDSISKLFIPWAIIGATVIGSLLFIGSQKDPEGNEDVKYTVNTLVTITRPHIFTVPLMAAVFMFLMTI